ncbi:MAG: ParB/RepB/Spo0J family partition protein [Chloroflexota bacterium]|nr:ParB/RepB/Spo0J family partition protein [Chloroflexota bacterium]
MSKQAKGIVKPDFSRERDQKLDLSEMFAASMTTQVMDASGQPGTTMEGARLLPLDLIDHNPYQARQTFDVDALEELADSIREHGVIEPVIVRQNKGRYEIVAGERRYRAALIAEHEAIPARIMELDDTQAAIFTALENLQREDLDVEDEGRQFAYLQQLTGLSQRKLALKLGKERQYISRRIRLLKRPDLLQDYRSGLRTLHQVLNLVGSEPAGAADAIESGEDRDESAENWSAGPTTGEEESGSRGPNIGSGVPLTDTDIELIERDDITGYMVARRHLNDRATSNPARAAGSAERGGTRFRWRPLQQFYTWVGRMKPDEVPLDERASVRAQMAEIKAKLEQLEKALEETEAPPVQ